MRRIVDECYQRARKLLSENLDKLKKVSERLLEKEVLESEEVKEIAGLNHSPKGAEKKAGSAGVSESAAKSEQTT